MIVHLSREASACERQRSAFKVAADKVVARGTGTPSVQRIHTPVKAQRAKDDDVMNTGLLKYGVQERPKGFVTDKAGRSHYSCDSPSVIVVVSLAFLPENTQS